MGQAMPPDIISCGRSTPTVRTGREIFCTARPRITDRVYVLSARPPSESSLFDIASKPFEPTLKEGDRLSFQLRANPVVRRKRDDGKTIKVDAVMHALLSVPAGEERSKARMQMAREVTEVWLRRLGARAVTNSVTWRWSATRKNDFDVQASPVLCMLRVNCDSNRAGRLLARLQEGFGSARAWGCGLAATRCA